MISYVKTAGDVGKGPNIDSGIAVTITRLAKIGINYAILRGTRMQDRIE